MCLHMYSILRTYVSMYVILYVQIVKVQLIGTYVCIYSYVRTYVHTSHICNRIGT